MHKEHAEKLLELGHAYRCFCAPDDQGGEGQGPARLCVDIPKDESDEKAYQGAKYAVRLKMSDRDPSYHDLVYGLVASGTKGHQRKRRKSASSVNCSADPVLLKLDGFPTYHLANVVDDHLMGITHVMRAAVCKWKSWKGARLTRMVQEWMPSTPMHCLIYEAFNWKAPTFAHVGLLQDQDRQKYSKRHGTQDSALDTL